MGHKSCTNMTTKRHNWQMMSSALPLLPLAIKSHVTPWRMRIRLFSTRQHRSATRGQSRTTGHKIGIGIVVLDLSWIFLGSFLDLSWISLAPSDDRGRLSYLWSLDAEEGQSALRRDCLSEESLACALFRTDTRVRERPTNERNASLTVIIVSGSRDCSRL